MSPEIPISGQQLNLWRTVKSTRMPATQCLFQISGEFPLPEMRERLARLVQVYDALRLAVEDSDGPVLQVADTCDLWIREAVGTQTDAADLARQERELGFDAAEGPQLRVVLMRDAEVSWLLLSACALFMDSTSLRLVAAQLVAAESEQAAPAQQYLEYCRQQDVTASATAEETGWTAFDAPQLPYARDAGQDSATEAGRWIDWTSVPGAGLERVCRAYGLNAESVLMAAFQGFVGKLSRRGELQMGYVADGRTLEVQRACVGLLAKTLPLRVSMRAGATLVELAKQAASAICLAREQQDAYDASMQAWQVPDDAHRVAFEFLRTEMPVAQPAGPRLEFCAGGSDESDLKLVAWVQAERVGLALVGRRASFDAQAGPGLLSLFVQWLARLLDAEKSAVLCSGLLDAESADAVIAGLNAEADTDAQPRDVPVHALFRNWAVATPDAIAVAEGEGAFLTYGGLAKRSDAFAAHLRSLGVLPGDTVAIHLPRSADLLVAVLGVYQLGGCHVLLDVQLPQARKAGILSDSAAKVMVSRHTEERWGLPVVLPDVPEEGATQESTAAEMPLESTAYLVYTSGSTGRPKGIAVSHGSLTRYLQWAWRRYADGKPVGAIAHTSPDVDLSITALLLPLVAGGCVEMVEEGDGIDALARLLRRTGHAGLLKMTPTHAMLLAGHWAIEDDPLPGFDGLVLGGENLLYEHLSPWLGHVEAPLLVNEYGPAEATVACCAFDIPQQTGHGRVPIGGPIAGARLYVLDEALRPVPDGVRGELVIAGSVLSEGYSGRPALTAAAFIPDPFGLVPGARAYRSGDLVAACAPGCLEYLGRRDRQVKIRGFRVELDEIEAVLHAHPEVVHVAVDLRLFAQDVGIAAYVVPGAGAALSSHALRDFCKDRLPAHMVPNDILLLDALPLTRSGKVDLIALARQAPVARSEADYVAARDEIEAALVEIWETYIGVERIGVRDNFFDLGGHSMMAMRILFDIRGRIPAELELGDIFDRPTVAELAEFLRQRGVGDGQGTGPRLPAGIELDPAGRYEPFVLTDVQQAYWVGQTDAYELGNVGAHVYQETQFDGLDLRHLETALRKLIDRHDMMRMIILPDGRQQVLEQVPDYEIEVFDLRDQTAGEQQAVVLGIRDRMTRQVFDVSQWPLFAVCACLIDEQQIRLHLSFDALMADAWSLEILLRDFSKLYTQPELALPPLQLTFRDYVQATADPLRSPLFRQAEDYWRDRIRSIPSAPQLPMLKQLGEVAEPRFERRNHLVDAERWGRIKLRAAAAEVTPSALLLAAFAEVLSRWSRTQSFTLVLTVFDRQPLHPEIDDIVGDFTSLVLIDFQPSDADFEQRAQEVQRRLMERLGHRFFSGVRVLREMGRQQGFKSAPIMPVVFTSTLTHRKPDEATFLKDQQVDAMGVNQTPQIYLDHQLVEENGELSLNWDSLDELFPAGMLDAMFERYCAFVDSLTEESAWRQPPDLLPATTLDAYASLNDTSVPPPAELALESILRTAASRPDSPAVITGTRQVSYRELTDTAWRVAHALRGQGVARGDVVGILLNKGWEQIASVLGVVLAGAAYIPIDPQAPVERVEYVMRDAGLSVLITQDTLRQPLSAQVNYLSWDERTWFEEQSCLPFAQTWRSEDLAYLIYTSGSTGRPKAVMIEHGSIADLIADVNARFAVGPDDRALGLTALHHDLSVFDIFGVLSAGAALVLPSAHLQRDPEHWTHLVTVHQVTLWNSVPAFMAMFLEYLSGCGRGPLPRTAGLRVLLSGDTISLSLNELMRQWLPEAALYSLGGPTETTVWDIWHPIGLAGAYTGRLPYGRPLNNARYYVLDSEDRLCPVNVPGELCIAGAGLARGYWRDEQKTAAKFFHHEATGERLYRSGDLGCLRSDGTIDILGRLDRQVKLHGQRIELEEIELVLQRHPLVRAATVALRADVGTGTSLTAYVELVTDHTTVAEPPEGSTDSHGMLLNAIERIQFKTDQRGIRKDIPAQTRTVDLSRPELTDKDLQVLMRRRTQRHFEISPISHGHIGGFLSLLMQIMPPGFAMPKYQYPSAGNAYPLQCYLLVRAGRIDGVPEGAYYYHPVEHRLIMFSPEGNWDDTLHAANNVPVSQQAAFSLFVLCDMAAMVPLYGAKAAEFGLLEAGHLGQLLMSRAPDFDLGLCPVGTMEFDELRGRLALGDSHDLFYAFLGGAVSAAEFSDPKLYLTDTSKKWTEPAESAPVDALAPFVRRLLPRHMVPDHFVPVEKMPYNSNGKVDVAALEAIEVHGAEALHDFAEPETELEQALAGLWADVLGVERVGRHDDFFQLGGDSILAVQLMNRLRASFSTEIPLREVVAATTVRQLAAVIEQKLAAELD
ncbi:amino acid adenylation domain-containing protein [Kribbella yunnanensis]